MIAELEKQREEKLIKVLELRNKVQELVNLWMQETEEIIKIEQKILEEINDKRSNKNNESVS